MSSQHVENTALHSSPAVSCTHLYLFSCICWRPMTEHDFPSKHETKQTYSWSIKTCIPFLTPKIPKSEPLGILSAWTWLLGTNQSHGAERLCDELQHHPVVMEGRKGWEARRETSGQRTFSSKVSNTKQVFTKYLLCAWHVNTKWIFSFFFMVVIDT